MLRFLSNSDGVNYRRWHPDKWQIPCPERYYRAEEGATGLDDCALCVSGGYCPSGSVEPLACPRGHYCVTGKAQHVRGAHIRELPIIYPQRYQIITAYGSDGGDVLRWPRNVIMSAIPRMGQRRLHCVVMGQDSEVDFYRPERAARSGFLVSGNSY